MLPKFHFVYGLVVAVILYLGFDVSLVGCLFFWVASVCIDVDHYLYYVYRKRDWSLWRARRWFGEKRKVLRKVDAKIRRKFYTGFCFLHGVEFLAIWFLLGYFVWEMFYFVGFGILLHLILDYIEQFFWKGRFDKFSILYDWIKCRKLTFVEEFEGAGKNVAEGLKK